MQRETKEVFIVDFSEETVRSLLMYMYGCLPNMPQRHFEVHPILEPAKRK